MSSQFYLYSPISQNHYFASICTAYDSLYPSTLDSDQEGLLKKPLKGEK